jgi:ABC-type uncharacterized transport system substrate-binding protein
MMKIKRCIFIMLGVFFISGLFPAAILAEPFKVLVVMSYEENFPWVQTQKEGIDTVLADSCEIKYFYMDTKINIEGGPEKAKEAYALYEAFQPHGVIAADDNAQSMFVVPYLKDKVKPPVMFCGVNAKPEAYGYPASNVSGIVERLNITESVALMKRLVPSVRTFGFIGKDSPTSKGMIEQIQNEFSSDDLKFTDFKLPKTLKEAMAMTEELSKKCDSLFVTVMEGIRDENGRTLADKEVIPVVIKTFGAKPTTCTNDYQVKNGVLCAMVQRGQEQGETAAQMLLKAMQGTPVSQIPITHNQHGKPVINLTAMKALGIKPKPSVLHGAELITMEK